MKKPKAERVRYIGLVNLRPEGMSIEAYNAWIDSPEMGSAAEEARLEKDQTRRMHSEANE